MKPGAPLARKVPMPRGQGFQQKEPKPKKIKPRKCKCGCGQEYMPNPARAFINWATDDCAVRIAQAKLAKQKVAKAKSERIEAKRRAEEGMPLEDRKKILEKLVNRYVVLRDEADGCISCHMQAHYDGAWHASHFKSVGSNSALRFNLWNIHKGCAQCNLYKSGNISEYEKRLVLKIGPERLEWIKNHPRSREYTAEYLIRFASIMRRKIKRLEARRK